MHRADALRRARGDDVAPVERGHGGDAGEDVRDLREHVAGVAGLDDLAVAPQDEMLLLRVAELRSRHDLRDGEERVVPLREVPRLVRLLQLVLEVAGRHVEAHGVPEHVVERALPRDAAAARSDDDGQFDFVVHVLRLAWQAHGAAARQRRGRGLEEPRHARRRGLPHLARVLRVVADEADDLAEGHLGPAPDAQRDHGCATPVCRIKATSRTFRRTGPRRARAARRRR